MKFEYTINYDRILQVKRRRFSRNIASKAIRNRELIKPSTCESCKNICFDIESHHIDYGKPLDVMWLCRKCHGKAHRKNSKLNPDNNPQTPIQFLDNIHKNINVSFTLPIKDFVNLLHISQLKGKSMSKLLKDIVMKEYPLKSNQLEFNFEVKNDESQFKPLQRISSMAKNEVMCEEPQILELPKIWGTRNNHLSGVVRKFWGIHHRHGHDTSSLRRIGAH